MANRSWLLTDRASFTVAKMMVTLSQRTQTLELLQKATTCIERVLGAIIRKAGEGDGVPGWHAGDTAMRGRLSPTPLFLDCHGHDVVGDFDTEFNDAKTRFVASLRSWLKGKGNTVTSPVVVDASGGDRARPHCGASPATAALSATAPTAGPAVPEDEEDAEDAAPRYFISCQ